MHTGSLYRSSHAQRSMPQHPPTVTRHRRVGEVAVWQRKKVKNKFAVKHRPHRRALVEMGHRVSDQNLTILERGTRVKKPRYRRPKPIAFHRRIENPHSEPAMGSGPKYTLNDIFAATRQEKKSIRSRDSKATNFMYWLETRRREKKFAPEWSELNTPEMRAEFKNLVATYMEHMFNNTYNLGTSLESEITAIRYVASLHGVYFGAGEFKFWRQYKTGCNEISRHVFGKPPGEQKRALLNPMIEAMLEKTNDSVTKLGILLGQRLGLRAQHYVETGAICDKVTYGSLYFTRDESGDPLSMTWRNTVDKNHALGSMPMDRTVYCTCHTKWSCLPHMADEFIKFNKYYLSVKDTDCLMQRRGKNVSYNEWLKETQELVRAIGLDPQWYGTHSYRGGCATEMDVSGATPNEIKDFGKWKTLESVFDYIRRNNPDMRLFWSTMDEYVKFRRYEANVDRDNFNKQHDAMLAYGQRISEHRQVWSRNMRVRKQSH